MKKVATIIALSFFFANSNAQDNKIAASSISGSTVQENKNQAEIKFDVEEYNFGTIKQGEKINYDFPFVNTGKEPLVIAAAYGSCGCTVPSYPKEPIAKGTKGVIHVEFNSDGKMGLQDKTVTVTSNAREGSKILHLKGNVETTPAEKK